MKTMLRNLDDDGLVDAVEQLGLELWSTGNVLNCQRMRAQEPEKWRAYRARENARRLGRPRKRGNGNKNAAQS